MRWDIWKHVGICANMSECVGNRLESVGMCWNMCKYEEYLGICQNIHRDVGICKKMLGIQWNT